MSGATTPTVIRVLDDAPNFASPVRQHADVLALRQAARKLAGYVGLDPQATEAVAIAASELAENLLAHAEQGVLALTAIQNGLTVGVQVESRDTGPGIADVERAMADGFSTRGSQGIGLGAVNRLMDEFEIESQCSPPTGTHTVSRKWKDTFTPAQKLPVEIDVAVRVKSGESVSGDTFVTVASQSELLVGVIDGVGHGEPAHKAAAVARHFVETHAREPLERLIAGTSRACAGTRGAVIALARIEWATGTLRICGLGNIEVRLIGAAGVRHVALQRGILGGALPRLRIEELAWDERSMLIMHSDGVASRWAVSEQAGLAIRSARMFAHELLDKHCDGRDDATVLAVVARS